MGTQKWPWTVGFAVERVAAQLIPRHDPVVAAHEVAAVHRPRAGVGVAVIGRYDLDLAAFEKPRARGRVCRLSDRPPLAAGRAGSCCGPVDAALEGLQPVALLPEL